VAMVVKAMKQRIMCSYCGTINMIDAPVLCEELYLCYHCGDYLIFDMEDCHSEDSDFLDIFEEEDFEDFEDNLRKPSIF
jgi:hypothetical protein